MSECIGYLSALRNSVEAVPLDCNDSIELLSSEDSIVDGVQVKVSKYVVDDASHRFDGLKASDFALSNLQAAGVDLRQQFCKSSSFAAVDYLEYQALKMSDFSNRVKSSEKTDKSSKKTDKSSEKTD